MKIYREGLIFLVFIFYLLSLWSCQEKHWVSPAFKGKVITETEKPIPYVKITLIVDNIDSMVLDNSDINGNFSIKANCKLKLAIFGDPYYSGNFKFEKEGYKTVRIDYNLITGDVANQNPPVLENQFIKMSKNY